MDVNGQTKRPFRAYDEKGILIQSHFILGAYCRLFDEICDKVFLSRQSIVHSQQSSFLACTSQRGGLRTWD